MKDHVVAIDLGTSCTAYSWKSAAEPTPSVGVPDMKPNEDIIGKSPTAILMAGSVEADKVFKPSGAEAYGRIAQRKYAENNFSHGAQLFKRFKMQLHSNPSQLAYDDLVNAVTKSTSKRAEMMLMDVFVATLEYIKNAALQRMTVTQPLTARDVTWVLTVPVCCSEPAKHFMRQAAVQAGFIQGGHDDEGLVLCMEPIAACLALEDRLGWRMNDKYLVIDCGGGTVDISAFGVVSVAPTGLEQCTGASGGPWGSTYADKQFESYLTDFVLSVAQDAGVRSLESFFASSAIYRILQGWERAKIGLRSVDHDCRIDLSELSSEPLEVEMEAMDNGRRLKNKAGGGEEMVSGDGTWELVLRPALLRKFFKPLCDSIARAVSLQLEKPELQGLTSVVMVGGFSGSVHVQEAVRACVRTKYPDNRVDVAIPRSPDLAIVQGAAHFIPLQQALSPRGRSPQYESVIAPTSYGTLVVEPGARSATPLFDPFFLKGGKYTTDHKVTKEYVVTATSPFVLTVSSSDSPRVHPGRNRLRDIGGPEALQLHEFSVPPPPPAVSTKCWFCIKSPISDVVEEDEKADVSVEFSLNGIELHVKVQSGQGKVLLQQAVAFPDRGNPPPPAYGTI